MEQGTGSGVAKITHESKKHKIAEGSWIVKAKEKGTVVKHSVLFKMFVLDGKHEELWACAGCVGNGGSYDQPSVN